jgi:hypothetical protein
MLARWNGHVNLAKRSNGRRSHFAAAIRKYGKDAFSHEVVRTFGSLDEANIAEKALIRKWRTRDPRFGFNLMKGGEHVPHSIRRNPWDRPGFREKITTLSMVATRTPEARSRCKKALSTPEVRARWSQASKRMWEDSVYKERMRIVSQSNPAILVSRNRRAEEAKAVRDSLTHIICPEHGSIPIAECYGRRSSKGRVHYSCKPCTRRSSDRAKEHRAERL